MHPDNVHSTARTIEVFKEHCIAEKRCQAIDFRKPQRTETPLGCWLHVNTTSRNRENNTRFTHAVLHRLCDVNGI